MPRPSHLSARDSRLSRPRDSRVSRASHRKSGVRGSTASGMSRTSRMSSASAVSRVSRLSSASRASRVSAGTRISSLDVEKVERLRTESWHIFLWSYVYFVGKMRFGFRGSFGFMTKIATNLFRVSSDPFRNPLLQAVLVVRAKPLGFSGDPPRFGCFCSSTWIPPNIGFICFPTWMSKKWFAMFFHFFFSGHFFQRSDF